MTELKLEKRNLIVQLTEEEAKQRADLAAECADVAGQAESRAALLGEQGRARGGEAVMSRTRPKWVEVVLFAVALVLLGLALVTSSGCAVVGRLAAGAAQAVVKCGRSPQVEREARKALDDVAAEAKLDELAKSSGWDVVVCAVEWLLRSLTGAAQADGELLAMSSDTRATKEYLQPQVDRARAWLALRKGAKR